MTLPHREKTIENPDMALNNIPEVEPAENYMPKKRVIGIYGVPGSGKSYLLDQLKRTLSTEYYDIFEGSELINLVVPGGLERFQKLDEEEKSHWRGCAIQKVKNEASTDQRTAIIAGHSMFWKEGEPFGIPVVTNEDLQTYTHILYLDVSPEVIAKRREQDKERVRPKASIDHLSAWQQSEKQLLQHQCYEHHILWSVISDRSAPFDQVLQLLRNMDSYGETANAHAARCALKTIVEELSRPWKTLLVIDADKTLTAVDTGEPFWDEVCENWPSRASKSSLKEIFGSKLQYTYSAFVQAMLLYEHSVSENEFTDICKAVASVTTVHPEFISLLQVIAEQDRVGAIVMTCGIGLIWEMVLERARLSDAVKVIGGGRFANGFVVTSQTKADLVKYAKQSYDLQVYAFGDSPLDLDMLIEADRAVVVVGEELTRSKSMEDSLRAAIDDGNLRARQVLLPSTVSPRLSLGVLPAMRLTDPSFFQELFCPQVEKMLYVDHATDRNAAKLLMTPMRNASVAGVALREAHRQVGHYLTTELLSKVTGVEEYPIEHVQGGAVPGYRIMHERHTLIVPLMRGGEPMAFGVNEVLSSASFLHAHDPQDIGWRDLQGRLSVILVDSVVNSGNSLASFVRRIRELHATIRIVAMIGVLQSDARARLSQEVCCRSNFFLVALRLSDNKFTGRGTTDTGNRLFNTTHLD